MAPRGERARRAPQQQSGVLLASMTEAGAAERYD